MTKERSVLEGKKAQLQEGLNWLEAIHRDARERKAACKGVKCPWLMGEIRNSPSIVL